LALVDIASPKDRASAGKHEGPMLRWMRLDGGGRPLPGTVDIARRATVGSSVDVVATSDGWLLGWTDRTGGDAQVMLALVDGSGRVRGPQAAIPDAGGSALVGMAAGPGPPALAWEEPRARAHPMRSIHVASIDMRSGLVAHSLASLNVASGANVELASANPGFALLASARACAASGGPCSADVVPTFVRFAAGGEPLQTEPLLLDRDRVAASLGWGLGCVGSSCFVLAATGDTPTSVYFVDLASRTSAFAPPLVPPVPADAPRVEGAATVATGPPLADVAATSIGDTSLVAALTLGEPGPAHGPASEKPPAASIFVHAVDSAGRELATPTTATSRALPAGGVAMAAAGRAEDGAVLVWVKRDDGDPQVHLARLDRLGRRQREVQLTSARGDAGSVAVAWAGDGWIVSWVDSRDGNGEVYAAKVDVELHRVSPEERLTHAPGDAADVALTVRNGIAWVAWSDPRESPREGLGDIYATTLRARDAKPSGDAIRVLATAAHSRSPAVAAVADESHGSETGQGEGQAPGSARGRALVAWIEDSPAGLEGPGAAMVALLDDHGAVVGTPTNVPLSGEGRPISIALSGAGARARAVVARASGGAITLDGMTLAPEGAAISRPWPLADLDAPPPFDVALGFAGDALYFDDVGEGGVHRTEHRIRRLALVWPR
jgi:hypothetical protein